MDHADPEQSDALYYPEPQGSETAPVDANEQAAEVSVAEDTGVTATSEAHEHEGSGAPAGLGPTTPVAPSTATGPTAKGPDRGPWFAIFPLIVVFFAAHLAGVMTGLKLEYDASSLCGVWSGCGGAGGCISTLADTWSTWAGLPVTVFALAAHVVIGTAIIGSLLVPSWRHALAWLVTFVAGGLVAVSLGFFLRALSIHAECDNCRALAGLHLLLLVASIWYARQTPRPVLPPATRLGRLGFAFALATFVAAVVVQVGAGEVRAAVASAGACPKAAVLDGGEARLGPVIVGKARAQARLLVVVDLDCVRCIAAIDAMVAELAADPELIDRLQIWIVPTDEADRGLEREQAAFAQGNLDWWPSDAKQRWLWPDRAPSRALPLAVRGPFTGPVAAVACVVDKQKERAEATALSGLETVRRVMAAGTGLSLGALAKASSPAGWSASDHAEVAACIGAVVDGQGPIKGRGARVLAAIVRRADALRPYASRGKPFGRIQSLDGEGKPFGPAVPFTPRRSLRELLESLQPGAAR